MKIVINKEILRESEIDIVENLLIIHQDKDTFTISRLDMIQDLIEVDINTAITFQKPSHTEITSLPYVVKVERFRGLGSTKTFVNIYDIRKPNPRLSPISLSFSGTAQFICSSSKPSDSHFISPFYIMDDDKLYDFQKRVLFTFEDPTGHVVKVHRHYVIYETHNYENKTVVSELSMWDMKTSQLLFVLHPKQDLRSFLTNNAYLLKVDGARSSMINSRTEGAEKVVEYVAIRMKQKKMEEFSFIDDGRLNKVALSTDLHLLLNYGRKTGAWVGNLWCLRTNKLLQTFTLSTSITAVTASWCGRYLWVIGFTVSVFTFENSSSQSTIT